MQLPILSSTSMYKLTVMNMTTAAIDQTDTVFRAALILEWVLISIGFGETMLLWYLLRYTNQYHRNLAMIVEQLPNQYFPSLIARMFMIYKQLTIPKTDC
uniref:Serpentine receptor class gamma n=1 Tax=Caenorhabditis tropicalis TaxID=1561998 RepID=A0A1I7UXH8_9PELO